MTTKIYDSREVTVVVAGIPISSGYAEGEFLKIEQSEEDFKAVVGTDGEVTRSKTNNTSAKVMLRLMQTSDSNAALAALRKKDLLQPNGAGVGSFLVKDRTNGTIIYQSDSCWIQKPPVVNFDKTATPREWELFVANLDRSDG